MWRLFQETAMCNLGNGEAWKTWKLTAFTTTQISGLGSPPAIHSIEVWADPGTSVLIALIQIYLLSLINNLGRVNRWIELLVIISNKLEGTKSILCFSGTPHFPIHSILPKIIISLVNQGLLKLCVNSGFTLFVSSNMSSKSCIRKWD